MKCDVPVACVGKLFQLWKFIGQQRVLGLRVMIIKGIFIYNGSLTWLNMDIKLYQEKNQEMNKGWGDVSVGNLLLMQILSI